MQRDNVCKFNFNRSSDLICLNFIREANNRQSTSKIATENSIHLVMSGSGILSLNGEEREIERGSLFFVLEGDEFSVSSTDALEYSYICFHGRRAEELMLRFDINENNYLFCGYDSLIGYWNECQDLAEDGNIDILCESVLLYTLAKLTPAKKERNDVVSRMISITQKNFTDQGLSISVIANELGYDPKYLSSLFKKKKGVSYTAYLRELRIRHAIFLMEQGVVSVKNVAILSGFGDPLYFSKIFTSAEGISPKDYIKKIELKNSGDY